jgi:Fe-S-cluster containining protein
MVEDSALSVLSESEFAEQSYSGTGKIIRLELDILGETVDLHIHVAQTQARLADIVPVARAICANITDTVLESVRLSGAHIPCVKGCSACCSYLVPLAVPEVFRLKQEVLTMPAPQRLAVQRECLSPAERILDQPPPESSLAHSKTDLSDNIAGLLNDVSNWYADFEMPCPFLHRALCTIYEQRPIACREYFITGCGTACGSGPGVAEKIEMPVRISEVLGRLASELEGTDTEALIMPLALLWAEQNPERDERTWPAEMMVERFVEIIKASRSENTVTPAAPAKH